ncbi:hypothetical protein NC653_010652 [Populus alba x Populus x berolinensis]|uniref:Uncharacterized protein n=1 Tax=Populus alba x Populus x berolinensis TaxID=444605 RepID=A0AAD6R1H1_9ROSI|nr:hypothetical protein NC653_010652 [Populus alba x Populus x berolinensis]
MIERITERKAKGRPKRKPRGLHLQSSSQQQQHMVSCYEVWLFLLEVYVIGRTNT